MQISRENAIKLAIGGLVVFGLAIMSYQAWHNGVQDRIFSGEEGMESGAIEPYVVEEQPVPDNLDDISAEIEAEVLMETEAIVSEEEEELQELDTDAGALNDLGDAYE